MKGVTTEREGDIYLLTFDTYSDMLDYLTIKRPHQISISYDGEKITGSMPVAVRRIDHER